MRALSLLSLLLLVGTWSYSLGAAEGFEFGDYFFTLFPQRRDPAAMEFQDPIYMPVNFLLYKRRKSAGAPRSVDYMTVGKENMKAAIKAMRHDLPTMLIIHGFMENIRAKVIDDSLKATTNSGRWNVIFVDWRELSAGPWYRSALLNVRATGKYVADFIDSMARAIDKRYEGSSNRITDDTASSEKRPSQKFLEDLHVVGFSLGSHVAGVAGYHLKTGKIGHITALDPAVPMIHLLKKDSERIDKSDAAFVDVWHTSSWGIQDPLGHADFYPNGGAFIQPGCETDLIPGSDSLQTRLTSWTLYKQRPSSGKKTNCSFLGCSHWQAWRFFAASVEFPGAFEAVPCGNWARFQKGYCDKYISYLRKKGEVHMEPGVRKTARGKFFLRTGPDYPYSIPLEETKEDISEK